MTVKITQRIKGFKVVDETLERPAAATAAAAGNDAKVGKAVQVVEMDEMMKELVENGVLENGKADRLMMMRRRRRCG